MTEPATGPPPDGPDAGGGRHRPRKAEQRCFEAYEHVALVWRAPTVAAGDRPMWRALAQVAAACCHVQRGNPTGARKILDRAARGLHAYASGHGEVDVDATLAGVGRLQTDLAAGREPGELPPLVPRDGS